ncbi:unnamed protein product [Caenorhabditis bovis]|uniref:alpha-1,2-Mannosidase n=1 Tax=Caenorhabditis bovis TaxID=2654633 RepID=A0A8S1EH70_9PELO|nr:unnamed protein product [Caenorhabditis bovis]
MQTIRFNKNALGVLVACALFLICVISMMTSSEEPAQISHVRDVQFRSAQLDELKKSEMKRKTTKLKESTMENLAKVEPPKVVILPPTAAEDADDLEKRIGKRHYADDPNDENDLRRQKVKEMMVHAWSGYKNYSWGSNELKPIAKRANSQNIFGGSHMPATIIDAIDTLYLMDLMDEFDEARRYIKEKFSMDSSTTTTLSVFETTIRILGGLLSTYAFTGDEVFLTKAREVGEALLPAFNTPSGIPKSNLDVKTKYASNYGWANGGQSILAEFGSLHLEFVYLSRASKSPIFEKKVRKVRDAMDRVPKIDGLYSNYVNPETGKFAAGYHMSLGALGDSFYEYLIKSYVQSNRTDMQAKRMYWEVSKAIEAQMIRVSEKSNLTYTVELSGGMVQHKMGHLACFVPGMFALQAANEETHEEKERVMKLAEELGKTCHESYIRSTTGIGPEMFYFNGVDEATSLHSENGYIQRPEVIEGWFYLWRLTGNEKYRQWIWDAIQAIDKHCRVEAGFAGLRNVYKPDQGYDDTQQSFLLAETFKYAYLAFADNSLIDLNTWVFNTEAHPFPILDH